MDGTFNTSTPEPIGSDEEDICSYCGKPVGSEVDKCQFCAMMNLLADILCDEDFQIPEDETDSLTS
jgi:hypothetical protein